MGGHCSKAAVQSPPHNNNNNNNNNNLGSSGGGGGGGYYNLQSSSAPPTTTASSRYHHGGGDDDWDGMLHQAKLLRHSLDNNKTKNQQQHDSAIALMPDSRRLGPPPRKEITLSSSPPNNTSQAAAAAAARGGGGGGGGGGRRTTSTSRLTATPPTTTTTVVVEPNPLVLHGLGYDGGNNNNNNNNNSARGRDYISDFGKVLMSSSNGERVQWTCDLTQLLRNFDSSSNFQQDDDGFESPMEYTDQHQQQHDDDDDDMPASGHRRRLLGDHQQHQQHPPTTSTSYHVTPRLCPSMGPGSSNGDFDEDFSCMMKNCNNSNNALPMIPTSIASPVFYAECNHRYWQLFLAPCDFDDGSVSVYLKCCGDGNMSSSRQPTGSASTTFYLSASSHGGASQAPLTPSTTCVLPTHEYELTHTFTRDDDAWGIQEFISLERSSPKRWHHHRHSTGTKATTTVIDLTIVFAPMNNKAILAPSIGRAPSDNYDITVLSYSPHIVQIDNFMTEEETTAFVRLAEPDLKRSRVANGQETPSRTSWSIFLTGKRESDPIVVALEDKIQRLLERPVFHEHRVEARQAAAAARRGTGCLMTTSSSSSQMQKQHNVSTTTTTTTPPPAVHTTLQKSEALQVVRYRTGEYYHEHYDNRAGNAAHRAATFMVYLCDVEAGGATYFSKGTPVVSTSGSGDEDVAMDTTSSSGAPGGSNKGIGNALLKSFTCTSASTTSPVCEGKMGGGGSGSGGGTGSTSTGLRIHPKRGRAILFWSRLPSGEEDTASIHAGETVAAGNKWILTRWLREEEEGAKDDDGKSAGAAAVTRTS